MAEPVKRLHYFDHQFLREKDFTDEQEYHNELRRLHSRLLHTWGVASGLTLSFAAGASRVRVSAGVAINGEGRELVLPDEAQTVDLSGHANKSVFITIAYDEQQSDPTSETGVQGNTRWTELPLIDVSEAVPADPSKTLILGRATVDAGGKVTGTDPGVDPNRRRSAGVVGGDLEVRSLTLGEGSVDPSRWSHLRLGAPNRTDLLESDLRLDAGRQITFADQGQISSLGDIRFLAGGANPPERLRIKNSGNVGIGTPNPSHKLHVVADGAVGLFESTSNTSFLRLSTSEGMNNRVEITNRPGGKLTLWTAAGGDVLNITRAGLVGIGTENPSHRFHVMVPDGAVGLFESENNQAFLRFSTNEGLNNRVEIANRPGGRLSLWTAGGLDSLNILRNGLVGIGTDAPNRRLHVHGSEIHSGGPNSGYSFGNRESAFVEGPANGERWVWYSSAGIARLWSGNDKLLIRPNGNFGIGVDPGFALDVGNRIRLRSGSNGSAGAWLWHPSGDRAFVGMATDDFVGLWGNNGAGWGLVMNTGNGNVAIGFGAATGSQKLIVNGNMLVQGAIQATGGKGGYVVDQFVNALADTLEEGDVVVIGAKQASLHYGVRNGIPIPEVDLTTQSGDTRVCGIVCEVHGVLESPPQNEKSKKGRGGAGPQPRAFGEEEMAGRDATKVESGQIGWMVTLGAYAHCKVDADAAPIEVGDLLMTSATARHAQKVQDPAKAAGAILGKALAPLKKGKGQIPVLVTLQ